MSTLKVYGHVTTVGELRRVLSALNDEVEVELSVSDMHETDIWCTGADIVADPPSGGRGACADIRVSVGAVLAGDAKSRVNRDNLLIEAWKDIEQDEACPMSALMELLRRKMCGNYDCWLYGSECCEDRKAKAPS